MDRIRATLYDTKSKDHIDLDMDIFSFLELIGTIADSTDQVIGEEESYEFIRTMIKTSKLFSKIPKSKQAPIPQPPKNYNVEKHAQKLAPIPKEKLGKTIEKEQKKPGADQTPEQKRKTQYVEHTAGNKIVDLPQEARNNLECEDQFINTCGPDKKCKVVRKKK